MDLTLENNYPRVTDFALQLTIGSGFLKLKDYNNLRRVDKFLKYLCEKNIEKYYNLLKELSYIPYITNSILRYWDNDESSNNYNTLEIYQFDNSDNIFNKKLNNDEMAFYYSYFIFKFYEFHSFYRTNKYSKFWMCILNKNGFIKIFARDYIFSKENYGFEYNDDIFLKIELYYRYNSWRKQTKKCWETKIKFVNKGKEFIPNFVNLKLLNNLITSNEFRSTILKYYL